jgi:RNA polymerase sigma factor
MPPDRDRTLDELLRAAQAGDRNSRDECIRKYTPFILSTVSRLCGHYVEMGVDDEASVALVAFNEAIDAFKRERGAGFLAFAQTVIKRRLIDHLRKKSSQSREIPLSALVPESEEMSALDSQDAQSRAGALEYSRRMEDEERAEEISVYAQRLQEFGIRFAELVDISPKHEDARVNAIHAARVVAGEPEFLGHLMERRELPLRELEKRVSISRKTLERQRKYIISVALILAGDFEYLRQYVEK